MTAHAQAVEHDLALGNVPWWRGRMASLDTETTGPNPLTDRIVQAAFCLVGGNEPPEKKTWLVTPGIDIQPGAIEVHGITNERARAEGLLPADVLRELAALLEEARARSLPVVIMNAPFDLTIIDEDLRRHDIGELRELPPIIDPRVLDKQADVLQGFHRKGSRKLVDLCFHYDAKIDGAHDACHDAMAAARVAFRIGQRFPSLGSLSLAELQQFQAIWYRDQAQSLDEYFRRQGKAGVDNFDWPIRRRAPAGGGAP